MARISSISLVAFGLVVLVQSCAAEQTREDYLDLPNPSEFDEPLHQNVRAAISCMDIRKNSKPEEIREEIEKLEEKGHTGVATALKNMDFFPPTNNLELIDTLKSIIAQKETKEKSPFAAKANVFLNNYVRPKFRNMDFWYKHAFNSTKISEVLGALDLTFSNGLNVDQPEPCHEDELEEWLQNIELDEAELNVPKMLKAIRGGQAAETCKATLGPFQWVMNTNCEKMHSFTNLIEMLEIDGAVRNLEDLPEGRPKRLDEYYQICKDWLNCDKRPLIEKNLQRQLDATRPQCFEKTRAHPKRDLEEEDSCEEETPAEKSDYWH